MQATYRPQHQTTGRMLFYFLYTQIHCNIYLAYLLVYFERAKEIFAFI